MFETVQRPLVIYYDALRGGRILELFTSGQITWWVGFLVVAALAYYLVARGMFTALIREGLRVGYSAHCAIVAGTFAVVVSFYLVFGLSPVKAVAWILEVSLLLAWFLYFIFSWVTAPPARG